MIKVAPILCSVVSINVSILTYGDEYIFTEEKSLSKWFDVTPDGKVISHFGCTVDVPEGALKSEAKVCLSFLKTGPPDGDCVTPILHVETQPKDLCFKRPVRVSLPVVMSSLDLEGESMDPELTLMCFREGIWKAESPKISLSETSFETTHFSGWVAIVDSQGQTRYSKDLVCYLFGKESGSNSLDLRMCFCPKTGSEIEVRYNVVIS